MKMDRAFLSDVCGMNIERFNLLISQSENYTTSTLTDTQIRGGGGGGGEQEKARQLREQRRALLTISEAEKAIKTK